MFTRRARLVVTALTVISLGLATAGCAFIFGGRTSAGSAAGAGPAKAPPAHQASAAPAALPAPLPAKVRPVTVEQLPLPAGGTHTVVRGNTVYAVSRLYGVPVRAIIEANSLEAPYILKPGDRLRIPSPRLHKVARGDTVYSISRRYGVAMNALMRSNGITPPYTVKLGQTLIVPSSSARPAAVATAPLPPKHAAPPSSKPATGKQAAALPKPAPRASKLFHWPVRGSIASGFGVQRGGGRNDGINIAAPRGASVVAAENGVVAYAGNELRGFGNLLLIKHADGYMTAYAHNETLLVARGQKVKRGQTIAKVGSTGSVATPQLHFEIRRGRKAVDPIRYLPRRSASR